MDTDKSGYFNSYELRQALNSAGLYKPYSTDGWSALITMIIF